MNIGTLPAAIIRLEECPGGRAGRTPTRVLRAPDGTARAQPI